MRSERRGTGVWRTIAALALAVTVAAPGIGAGSPRLGGPSQRVLIYLKNPLRVQRGRLHSIGNLVRGLGARNVETFHLLSALSATMTTGAIEQLRLDPNVLSVQPDRFRKYKLDIGNRPAEAAGVGARSTTTTTRAGATIPPTSGPGTAPCPTPAHALPQSPLFSKVCTHEANDITHATEANAAGYDGSGVTVADIDTGFDVTHPNLNVRANGDGLTFKDPANFNETTPGTPVINTITDFVGHGTATASQIIAQGNIVPGVNPYCAAGTLGTEAAAAPAPFTDASGSDNYCIYYKGMAPGATLIPIEGLGAIPENLLVGGTDGEITRAVQWAVDHGADLINESFGGITPFVDAVDPLGLANSAAVAHGVAVFGAMGNDGPGAGTDTDTALNPDVIGVGAEAMYRAFYAENFVNAQPNGYVSQNVKDWTSRPPGLQANAKPDLVAPGAFGWANFPMATAAVPLGEGSVLGSFGGTSQATPVAVANAALVIQAYKQKFGSRPTPQVLKSILMATATDLGYSSEYQGAGAINSMAAIEAIKSMKTAIRSDPVSIGAVGSPGEVLTQYLRLTNMSSTTQTVHLTGTHEVVVGGIDGKGVMTKSTALDGTGRPTLQLAPDGTLKAETNNANFAIPAAVAAQHPELMRVKIAYYDPTGCVALRVRAYNNKGQWLGYGQGAADAAPIGQNTGRQPSETLAIGHYTELTWNLHKTVPTVTGSGSPEGTATGPFQILVYARNTTQAPGGANADCGSKNPNRLPITWRVEWTKRATTDAISAPSVRLGPNASASVPVRITFPDTGLGTAYDNVAVTTATSFSQIPVQLRVKVPVVDGVGTFAGHLSGSEKEYTGGEAYYYQFDVPVGTPTLDAWVNWPDDHNQIFTYLISPDDQIEVSKFSSLPNTAPLIAGNATHGTHMAQANPRPGLWTVLVYGYGFYGGSLAEPFKGTIRLGSITPTSLVANAKPGQTVSLSIPVVNGGGADFFVQAIGQLRGFVKKKLADISGQLPNVNALVQRETDALQNHPFAAPNGLYLEQWVQGLFQVPPDTQSITATATSSGDPIELDLLAPDLSYWGYVVARTSSSNKGAQFAPFGNTATLSQVTPSRGTWGYNIGYSNPNDLNLSTITGEVTGMVPITWSWVLPKVSAQESQESDCSGSNSSGAFDPHCGAPQRFSDASVVHSGKKATLKVSVKVPAGVASGAYTGNVVLYTIDGDLIARIPTTVCVLKTCFPSVLGSKTTRKPSGSTGGAHLPATGVGDFGWLGLSAIGAAFATRRWKKRIA